MENKLRILKVLEAINKAQSRIEYKRLDILINTNLFNIESDKPLWGGELLELLKEMKVENLILQDEEKKYLITKNGLNYLEKNSN